MDKSVFPLDFLSALFSCYALTFDGYNFFVKFVEIFSCCANSENLTSRYPGCRTLVLQLFVCDLHVWRARLGERDVCRACSVDNLRPKSNTATD